MWPATRSPVKTFRTNSPSAVHDYRSSIVSSRDRERDGVNVKIHHSALPQISDDRLGWLVPGLLQTKLTGMIKSLPKRIRRNLVPAADVAAKIARDLKADFGKVAFLSAVCREMSRHADVPITPDDFQRDKLDEHFQFLVTVVDDDGSPLAEGRELAPLQQQLVGTRSDEPVVRHPTSPTKIGRANRQRHLISTCCRARSFDLAAVSRWLSIRVSLIWAMPYRRNYFRMNPRPTRRSARGHAAVRDQRTEGAACRRFDGCRRSRRSKIKLSGVLSAADVENALVDLLARIAFVENEPVVRSRPEFERRQAERGRRIAEATQELASWLTAVADNYFSVRRELESLSGGGTVHRTDGRRAKGNFNGCFTATSWR